MASGNLGLITFPRIPRRATLERIEQHRPGLIETLRTHPGIGFVLVRSTSTGRSHSAPTVASCSRPARSRARIR